MKTIHKEILHVLATRDIPVYSPPHVTPRLLISEFSRITTNFHEDDIGDAWRKLISENFITIKGDNWVLSEKGVGAYNIYLLERKKLELEVKQIESNINTNTSVQTNIKTQEKIGNRSLILAGISVLFIALTFLDNLNDKSSKELQELRQQLQKSTQSLDSIQLFLKGIDSSMKISVDNSSYKIFKDSVNKTVN